MTAITFDPIEGGETTTEFTPSRGAGALPLTGFGYASTLLELGAAGAGVLRLAQYNAGAEPDLPTFGIGDGTLPLLAAYSYGAGVEAPATGEGTLALTGRAYETSNVGYATLPVIGFGQSLGEDDVAPPPVFLDSTVAIADGLVFGSEATTLLTLLLRAKLQLGAEPRPSWEGVATLTDTLALEDGLVLVFRELMQVSLALGDATTVSTTAIVQMVDALLLGGVVATELEAVTLIVEALTFGALASTSQVATLLSGLSLGDSVAHTYQAMAALVDSLLLGETVTSQVTMVAAISDALAIGADGAYHYEAHAVLRDGLAFMLRLAINNEDYVAWAINTESKGLSRYTQYPFNSFMKVGDKYYGATDTGLHLLEGDDDAGVPIEAKLRLGMSSMGTRVMKRSPAMYAGYTASGDLLLKVVTANAIDSEREAHAYRLIARAAGSMREGRVPIGKGIKAVYFDYQLENIDGADFELDVIEFQPLVLERRVRGNSGGKR